MENTVLNGIGEAEAKPNRIEEIVKRLNAIQSNIYANGRPTYTERQDWKLKAAELRLLGYVLRKKTVKNAFGRRIQTIWRAVPIGETARRTRHFTAELKRIDMTPNDGQPTCRGNCTTRAMAYCLKGIFTYREIEHEQYRLADVDNRERGLYHGDHRRKTHRNSFGTWDKIMLDLGYVWLELKKKVRRDRIAHCLREISYPMITHSRGHVAVVESGAVVDTWDSRHGRCDMIMLKAEDIDRVRDLLFFSGFRYET